MSVEHYKWDNDQHKWVPCSDEEGWAEEAVVKDAIPAYTPPAKKMLTDIGTRFNHLNDLLDYLDEGVIAVTNSLKRYKNESDETRLKRLESAIILIQIYQSQMANWDNEKWSFNKMLDNCVPELGVLESIRKERVEKLKIGPDTKLLGE